MDERSQSLTDKEQLVVSDLHLLLLVDLESDEGRRAIRPAMTPLLRQLPGADSAAKNHRLSSRARVLIRIFSATIAMMVQLMANQRLLCHLVDLLEATRGGYAHLAD